MKAYLEKINKEWLDDFVYISKYNLESRGYDIVPFDGDDLINGHKKYNFHKYDVMIGSVESTKFFFDQIGVKTPGYIGYPAELSEFYKRKISLKKIKDLDLNFPYFIKPAGEVKLFTGFLIENESLLNLFTNFYNVTPETDIYVSEAVDIKSEWRCFVFEKKLVGIQYYLGDFRKYPDDKIVDDIIGKYENQPIAYTIDVGVNDKEETIIVEINDMWSIGSYGLNRDLYTKMCIRRMREIVDSV